MQQKGNFLTDSKRGLRNKWVEFKGNEELRVPIAPFSGKWDHLHFVRLSALNLQCIPERDCLNFTVKPSEAFRL
jgi:hypothetical protein